MVVLGISLGTTTTGIAIMSNGQLVFWKTHSFRDTWSDDKAHQIVSRYEQYLNQYRPKIAIIKIPALYHHTDAITTLLKKVQDLFSYHGCMVEYKTKEEIKAVLPHVRNQSELMKHVTENHPILLSEYTKATNRKNQYHAKLFDAVMMAHQGKDRV